jgi:hypothetical protein
MPTPLALQARDKRKEKEQSMARKAPGSRKLRKALSLAGEAAEDKTDQIKKAVTGKYDDVKSALGDAAVAVAGKVEKAGKAAKKGAATAKPKNKKSR